MKTKLFVLFAIFAVMAATAFAQVGGNDWTVVSGGPFTITPSSGAAFSYQVNYSPSSVKRDGDWVTVIFEGVFTDSSPTKFYQNRINCKTHQYVIAKFDITTTPATLGEASEVRDIKPNTAGPYIEAVVCK